MWTFWDLATNTQTKSGLRNYFLLQYLVMGASTRTTTKATNNLVALESFSGLLLLGVVVVAGGGGDEVHEKLTD